MANDGVEDGRTPAPAVSSSVQHRLTTACVVCPRPPDSGQTSARQAAQHTLVRWLLSQRSTLECCWESHMARETRR